MPEEPIQRDIPVPTDVSPFGFKKIILSSTVSQEVFSKKKIADEFAEYMKDVKLSFAASPSDYWKVAKLRYPKIFRIYLQLMGIPATSASVERFFSQLTLHSSGHKSNSKPEYLSNKCILSFNIDKLSF